MCRGKARRCGKTYDIGMTRRRLDKVVIAALDEAKVLIQDTVYVSAAFLDVSSDPAGEHQVRVAILLDQFRFANGAGRQQLFAFARC